MERTNPHEKVLTDDEPNDGTDERILTKKSSLTTNRTMERTNERTNPYKRILTNE